MHSQGTQIKVKPNAGWQAIELDDAMILPALRIQMNQVFGRDTASTSSSTARRHFNRPAADVRAHRCFIHLSSKMFLGAQ